MNTKHYDKKYYDYQRVIGEAGGRLNLVKFADLFKQKNITVMDFGCGGGFLLSNIDVENKIGFEINPHAIEECKQNGISVYSDWKKIKSNTIDVVVSNHALEHVPDPLKILKKIKDVIKPSGKVAIVVPCEQPHERGWKYTSDDINNHLWTWCPQTLGNLAKLAGLKVLRCEAFQHQWTPDWATEYKSANYHARCVEYAKRNNNYQIRLLCTK